MVRMYWPLAVVTAGAAIPIIIFSRSFEKEYRTVARQLQDQEGDLATSIEESATGARVIKAFGRHKLVQGQFADGSRTVLDTAMKKVRLRGKFWAVLGIVPNLTMAGVLFIGALAVANGSLTKGGLAAFVSLVLMLVWPVESLGEILAMGEEAETAAERIFEVLDTEPDIADRPGARRLRRCRGRVAFDDVSFAYDAKGEAIVRDISLAIEPGETLALVGVTGSGKTTLAALVPRLYDVTAGRITLDGCDIRDIRLANLRRHVSVAFEETILFSASVRENLLLGRSDATDVDMRVALETAQATFAYDLPWGLDTRIGEQGLSLSGGQRQRLALARAVIGRPRVLILDDPLSALDVHTEALVEDALRRVLEGVTALLVVHRPSTLALADRVALLSGGTIAAVGSHSRLMDTVPEYRAILSQAAEEPTGSRAREEVA
jgi:ATP-binding cassette subfamily B protein